MSLYELVVEYELYGQIVMNRFHYQTANDVNTATASGLIERFETQQIPAWVAVNTNNASGRPVLKNLRARNLYDPTDFAENLDMGYLGGDPLAGQAMPPFVAVAFRSARHATGRNRAYARMAGVPEGFVTGNQVTNQAYKDNLAFYCSATITWTGNPENNFIRVLLYMDKVLQPDGSYKYQLYPTEAQQQANRSITGTLQYYRLTTQRSRQQGVGQ